MFPGPVTEALATVLCVTILQSLLLIASMVQGSTFQ